MNADDGAARKAQTRAVFDRLAADYDVAGPGCFAEFGQRLVDEVGVEPGARVLDVASGRGAVLFPAAERAGPTGSVVGIDLSEAMAQATNEDARRRGINAHVRVMDAEQLGFPDGSFDAVLCGFGVMFFLDLGRALGEFRRVLKPAGRIGVSTFQVSQADDLIAVLDEFFPAARMSSTWITDPELLARLLSQAGFTDAGVIAATTEFRYDDLDQYWQNARGTGLRQRLDALDAEQTELVRTTFAQRVRGHQRADGLYLEATALLATARSQDVAR